MKKTKTPKTRGTYFVWDISREAGDTPCVYEVEHKDGYLEGETRHKMYERRQMITHEGVERVINKARRACFERTGNRKCMMLTNEGFYPYQEGIEIVKVPITTRPLKKWEGRKRVALAEYEFGDEFDWENFLYEVQAKMGKNEYWRINGKNIDWRARSGYKYVHADTATELLRAIYHEDIVRMYCGSRGNRFELNAPTHDTPMGSFYEFVPVSLKTYEQNS